MGNPATPKSDIYALGIIFRDLLVGPRPFEAESVSELIALHVKAPRPMLPENLRAYQALLDRLLAVDPRKRFASADELIEGIDEVWTRQAVKTLQTRSAGPAQSQHVLHVEEPVALSLEEARRS